ncbi:MAG: PEP-CTERM sorting domain-containing protein [Planctomycetia bacterium]|nr:PEP-CTERM sorting domain-containing protein [Planctomycetia bacterium]
MRLLTLKRTVTAILAFACFAAWAPAAQAQNLQLLVDPISGSVTLANQSFTSNLSLDGYDISSTAGSLVPDPTNTPNVGWDSLTDAGLAGWSEASATANALAELNLTSSLLIIKGGTRSLGKAFTPSGTTDLAFSYSVPGGPVSSPAVVYTNSVQVQVVNLLGNGGAVVTANKAVLLNGTANPLTIDGYEITSAAGSLNPVNFHGFADGFVAGWSEANLTVNSLAELNLTGSSTLAAGGYRALQAVFTTGTQDLAFQYDVPGVGISTGALLYKQQLAGDLNNDHIVDVSDIQRVAANYLQNSLAGDANFDGIVDVSDIQMIAANYLNTIPGSGSGVGGGGAVASVPEPSSLVLAAIGLAIGSGWTARARQKRVRTPGK